MMIAPSGKRAPLDAVPRTFGIKALFLCLLLFFGVIGGLFYSVYVAHAYRGIVPTVARFLPLPVAQVEGKTIFYREVADLAFAFESVDASDPLLSAINRRIFVIRLEHLVRELEIDVDDVEHKMNEEDRDVFLSHMHWSARQYDEYVLKPYALATGLEEAVRHDVQVQKAALRRAEQVLEDVEEGILFSDLAMQYSDASSARGGGDLGYMSREELGDAYEDVFALEVGDVSDILDTGATFVIAQVYDRLQNSGDTLVALRVIEIKKDDLAAILHNRSLADPGRRFLR